MDLVITTDRKKHIYREVGMLNKSNSPRFKCKVAGRPFRAVPNLFVFAYHRNLPLLTNLLYSRSYAADDGQDMSVRVIVNRRGRKGGHGH